MSSTFKFPISAQRAHLDLTNPGSPAGRAVKAAPQLLSLQREKNRPIV
jgi:hypothetical protein